MTKELANTEIAPGQSAEIYLDISIPLSSDNNDLNFLNTTEIVEYEISTGKMDMEALFNLLDNAVKYTPIGGKIDVTVEQWEMYLEIKVTDTGKGISESNQAAIFRRFYREEEVHEQPGVGIGLYLAREIITQQGGYIKVVSELGEGSSFSIMLPLR